MILRFKAYSKTNRDIDYVIRHGRLRGCKVNDPILVFGENIYVSELNLNKVYSEIHKFITKDIDLRSGSFEVEVDDLVGKVMIEKYGFKEKNESKTNRSRW